MAASLLDFRQTKWNISHPLSVLVAWGAAVPITPFLEEESVFDPETIKLMGKALTNACQMLGLKQKDDAANRLLAARIIDLAQAGVRDAEVLTAGALEGLRRRAG